MSQSVDRALTLLGSLGDGPVTLEQAAGSIGVHKSTALRLLRTLEEHGFVHRLSDRRYRVGGRVLSLAQRALQEIDVRQVAAPYLAALNERCGCTVQLAVLQDDEVLYLDELAGRWSTDPGRPTRIGRRASATGTAIGRVLLAGTAATGTATTGIATTRTAPTGTAPTRTATDTLAADLAAVRRRGWAAESAEPPEAVSCVAAPVAGSDGRAVAACAISAPADRMPPAELLRLVPELLCTAEAVSLAYGGSPTPRWCENRCGARPAARASRT
ncbi:IclR family transcriptional regulator [Kitasatospora purpeofusca]|uniref:IclR family transcriptional regulator n=1 Tax=Kitasatospora purpeofusca TaxID=67352 RepID=UPI002A599762|nr:IclR family transcriptional regulator [Kitasatospora purpeofusca]MDY0810487.1 IclR family transcriptional regulator [Kitasatospora purpeofusca]